MLAKHSFTILGTAEMCLKTIAHIKGIHEWTSDLPTLVRRFSRRGCFNKLDRVYALLSLAENGDKFRVDYDAEIEIAWTRDR